MEHILSRFMTISSIICDIVVDITDGYRRKKDRENTMSLFVSEQNEADCNRLPVDQSKNTAHRARYHLDQPSKIERPLLGRKLLVSVLQHKVYFNV